MSRASAQMLDFPTVPRGDITLIVGNELSWSACYVGLSLAFINPKDVLAKFFLLMGIKMLCTPVFVTFACLSVCRQFLSN